MSIEERYRSFVGPPDRYDIMSAIQFNLMTVLGLRESNTLLDIGCGSLRAGRLFIAYLKKGNYFCIEPEKWLVEEGIHKEIGGDMVKIKSPTFLYRHDWSFDEFNKMFDFVIAQSIFSHASKAQIATCLDKLADCTHNSSIFAATFFVGNTDYDGNDWAYPRKVSFRAETIEKMIADAGFIGNQIGWPHPSQTWYLISKPENSIELNTATDRINQISGPVSAAIIRKI